jgi:outer membrane receptor for ferric coprogen and ferric-rhodotorulic acid
MRSVATLTYLACAGHLLARNLTLSGQVKDQSGQPISGAAVTLKGNGRHARVRETDTGGAYLSDKLNAGAYTLEVSKQGFELLSKQVNINQDLIESPVLAVGAQSQSITVEATLGRTTAPRMDIPVTQLPVSFSSVPTMTLVEQASNDLPSVLRNAAGVQGLVWYGVHEYHTIRGFNNQDVQLVDGIRQEGNRFNTQLNNVEQVDILRGPGSVLSGPSALGGVINIIRMKPTPFKAYDLLMRAGRFKTFQVGGGRRETSA